MAAAEKTTGKNTKGAEKMAQAETKQAIEKKAMLCYAVRVLCYDALCCAMP